MPAAIRSGSGRLVLGAMAMAMYGSGAGEVPAGLAAGVVLLLEDVL